MERTETGEPRAIVFAFADWQTKEGSRLVKDVGEAGQVAIESNEI